MKCRRNAGYTEGLLAVMGPVAPQESTPDSPRCVWSVDQSGFRVCTTRRALRRAVEQTTLVAAQVREARARSVAIRRKEQAIKDLLAHRCDVLGAPRGKPRPITPPTAKNAADRVAELDRLVDEACTTFHATCRADTNVYDTHYAAARKAIREWVSTHLQENAR